MHLYRYLDRSTTDSFDVPLYCVIPLKSELLLTSQCNGELMISHRCVEHPNEAAHAEFDENCCIAPGDGVCNDTSDIVERDVIYLEMPDEIINVLDMLLMGFRRQ